MKKLENLRSDDPTVVVELADALSRYELTVFTEHVLGFDNSEHHIEWYDILQDRLTTPKNGDWDSELVELDGINYLIMLLAPRSHSKSTSVTVNYPLWLVGRNPNIRILIVSASLSQSSSFLREIKGHIERNESYHRVFGNLSPENLMTAERWTTTEIIVNRDDVRLKDPTVAVTSTGGTVLSKRADVIICDDILDEKNTRTAEQRRKTKEWFDEVLMPVLEPEGRLIMVGTAWNKEDLYHQIMGMPIYDVRKRYKAILDDDKREVLWGERWSYEKLMKRKEQMGSLSFNKSYQNEAMTAEDAVFQYEWTEEAKKKGRERKLIDRLDYARWDLGGMTISMGVDLAISQKDESDYTAMVVVGRTRDGMKIPLWMLREKLSPAQTRERIKALYARYGCEIVIVENNAYQEALRRDLADTTDMPIKGYTTGGEKYDLDVGINSLAVEFENGKWILPYSHEEPYTQNMVDILVGGMLDFPGGHTEDLLMALWFANQGLRQLESGASDVRSFDSNEVLGLR